MSFTLPGVLSLEYANILSHEGKKKNSELKKATEDAMTKIKNLPQETDPLQDDEIASILVEPLILATKSSSKTPKLLASILALICRLVSQTVFPPSRLVCLLDSLLEAIAGQQESLSTDNALRVIQIAMGTILNYPQANGAALKKSFDICIRFVSLNDVAEGKKKNSSCSLDVLNAASVTLRQIAMTSVVKLRELGCMKEDEANATSNNNNNNNNEQSCGQEQQQANENVHIRDVKGIFGDLSAKILREKTCFLEISCLNDNHCLEMIESMLAAGNASILTQIPQLRHELERNLFPAIVRKFAEKQNYPVYLRILRIMKIALLDFSGFFPTTCQVLFELMLKDLREYSSEWQSILCLEVLKGLFGEENDSFLFSCFSNSQSIKNLSEFFGILLCIFQQQENCTSPEGGEQENAVLSGEPSKNKLKNFDQLEKNVPFPFQPLYQARLSFEIFSFLIEKLLFEQFLQQVSPEEQSKLPQICFEKTDFFIPKFQPKSPETQSVNPIVLVKLSEHFKGIFSLLYQKYNFDSCGVKLINQLLYHSLTWSIFNAAEELFCACYEVVKSPSASIITRQMLIQFALYYYSDHSFDWYPILQICLAYPGETASIFDLTEAMPLSTMENFVSSLSLLSFDVTSSDSDVNFVHCKFLLLKIKQIFLRLMLKFSQQEEWVCIFKALLFHLAGLSFSREDKVKSEAMECLTNIIRFYCSNANQVLRLYQIELIGALQKALESSNAFVRFSCYDSLLTILQSLGPSSNLTFAWPQILSVIDDAHSAVVNASGTGIEQVKKKAFESLEVIFADLLAVFPEDFNLKLLTVIQGFIGQQSDLNMSLTAVEGLWKFSDHLIEGSKECDWKVALKAFHDAGLEPRNEIRNAAVQSLFRAVSTKSEIIQSSLWTFIFNDIFFSLLDETLQQKHVEALVFAIQGLCGIVYSLFDYFIERFEGFFTIWKRLGNRLIELFDQDIGEKDEISLAASKGFKLVLTSCNKSIHKNDHWEEWKYYFDLWLTIGNDCDYQKSDSKIYSQAVLTQYVACFGYWHNSLLKSTPCYSDELLEKSLHALYISLAMPICDLDVVNDLQVCSLLQNAVLDQIKKNVDVAAIPGSIDILCLFWGKIVAMPMHWEISPKTCKLPSGIGLSSHVTTFILSPLLSLWKIREATIGHVLREVFNAFNVSLAKSTNDSNALSALEMQFLLLLQDSIGRIVVEEGHEMPIGDALYGEFANILTGIIQSSINYADANCCLLGNYGNFIRFIGESNIISFVPTAFGQRIMKSLFELSLLVSQREALAFEAFEVFFHYACSMKWMMEMLEERVMISLSQYSAHLKLYGKVPMLDVKYREINALLGGFLQRSYDLNPFCGILKGISVECTGAAASSGKQYSPDVWKLIQQAILAS